jgi:HSP20 family molecular chaperone IbpA
VTGARLDVVAKRQSGDVKRSYTLSDTLDHDGCTAKLENGVLAVTFPLRGKQKQEPRKIAVQYRY